MTAAPAETAEAAQPESPSVRVVYLLGAGATQGCISHGGGRQNLLMSGLAEPLSEGLRQRVDDHFQHHAGIERLINDVVTSESPGLDFEQLITFLDDSPTRVYREFSNDLRDVFSSVLRRLLEEVENELGRDRSRLYAVLVDMHDVEGSRELLGGFLTLNYDVLLEHAVVDHLSRAVDYGISTGTFGSLDRAVRVLKMHGSFGWSEQWPLTAELKHSPGFWIPPGIRKPKSEYPFNAIWGLAREMLACDVLRIIGCNLGPNDWDLVSLLFSTQHTHGTARPYRIEVISGYDTAQRIQQAFPYLEVQWLPELPIVGDQIVGEMLGSHPQQFAGLSEIMKQQVVRGLENINNPFQYWLTQMGEAMSTQLDGLATASGVFEDFIMSGK